MMVLLEFRSPISGDLDFLYCRLLALRRNPLDGLGGDFFALVPNVK
jgi:hypothetical protein